MAPAATAAALPLAVIGLVPLVVVVLLWLFDLPTAFATGLAVLAAAPGAPMIYKRAQMAGGDLDYAASPALPYSVWNKRRLRVSVSVSESGSNT